GAERLGVGDVVGIDRGGETDRDDQQEEHERRHRDLVPPQPPRSEQPRVLAGDLLACLARGRLGLGLDRLEGELGHGSSRLPRFPGESERRPRVWAPLASPLRYFTQAWSYRKYHCRLN